MERCFSFLWNLISLFFSFVAYVFGIHLRIHCQSWSQKDLPLFSSNSSIPLALILGDWSMFLFFLLMCGVRQEFRTVFFSCSYPGVPAPFVDETIVSLLNGHGTFVKNQFDVDVWIHLYTFNSVPWVFMSILPVPLYFNYCSFTVSLEIRKYESSRFVLFFSII